MIITGSFTSRLCKRKQKFCDKCPFESAPIFSKCLGISWTSVLFPLFECAGPLQIFFALLIISPNTRNLLEPRRNTPKPSHCTFFLQYRNLGGCPRFDPSACIRRSPQQQRLILSEASGEMVRSDSNLSMQNSFSYIQLHLLV